MVSIDTFCQVVFDELVKSLNSLELVIPVKAGIQLFQVVLDPGFRRGDDPRDFTRLSIFIAVVPVFWRQADLRCYVPP